MKRSSLSSIHEDLGAKMVNFANYYMPIHYKGVNIEHNHVRESVGIFDVSHMGEIFIKGKQSLDFLQYITTNDVSKLSPGKVQYTCFPNSNGGIVDDLLLYMIDRDQYLLVVNASNIEKDLDWIKFHNSFDCIIDNQSENYSLIAIQGPQSLNLLQELTPLDLNSLNYYHFKIDTFAEIDNIIISRTGYTGELGFELYVTNDHVVKLWQSLFKTSVESFPIGLAARDTLRLEKGFCLYGNDINDSTSPLEAGLGWITKFSKKFINSDNLFKQSQEGVNRRLVGIELQERGIARKDYFVLDRDGNKIGIITSGTMSPTLNKAIALAYISSKHILRSDEIFVQIRNKSIKSKIVSIPFI